MKTALHPELNPPLVYDWSLAYLQGNLGTFHFILVAQNRRQVLDDRQEIKKHCLTAAYDDFAFDDQLAQAGVEVEHGVARQFVNAARVHFLI